MGCPRDQDQREDDDDEEPRARRIGRQEIAGNQCDSGRDVGRGNHGREDCANYHGQRCGPLAHP